MTKKQTKLQMEKLIKELKEYNNYYYEKNRSLISDVEYDNKLKELEKLEKENPEYLKKNSPSLVVGESLKKSKFSKVEHKKPMLSLANTYNLSDLYNFDERVKKILNKNSTIDSNNISKNFSKIEYVLELKIDGVSISLHYENGNLVKGVTRGDGKIGEDVTENIMQIKSIPKKLNKKLNLEVRGEIVLLLNEFESLNKNRIKLGEEIFANPRNAASGTLRQKDSLIVKNRNLDAYIYYLADSENLGLKNHIDSIKYLEELGFKTTGVFELVDSVKKIGLRIKHWETKRKNLDYETDGLVIKVNNIELHEKLGVTTKSPRWAISYKFPAKQVTTKLLGVTWQVGRTGKITPVAELEPVEVSGSVVRRASLHNYDEILRKNIKIGDVVFIEKAAEIIPQIVKPIVELRTGKERIIVSPTECPICHSFLEKEDGLVNLKCINPRCKGKLQGKLKYFISRDAMNITGGSKIIEKFIALGYLNEICDFYSLYTKKEELEKLENFGIKSIEKLLSSIEDSKKLDYSKTLYALGIPFVGRYIAELLTSKIDNIDDLMTKNSDDLMLINGIGEKVATSIYGYFQNEQNRELINKLKKYGINFISKKEDTKHQLDKFQNKTFLFTGKFIKLRRSQLKELIKKIGGINVSAVSQNLDYLIVGKDPGSKLKKSNMIKSIKILTEDEFFKLV